MPLVLGFIELAAGALLLAMAITGASAAEVLKGEAGQAYAQGNAAAAAGAGGGSSGASSTGASAAAVNQATGAGGENPFALVKGAAGERVDQGKDVSTGSGGPIVAPTAGKIVAVVPVGSGWEGGGAVVEQLASGADVYFEEGVRPLAGLLGRAVTQGEAIAEVIPGFHSGIEAGFAAPTSSPGANYIGGGYETQAQATTGYTEGQVTPAGTAFTNWLHSLGFTG